jgi:hypothetical protein
MLKIIKSKVLVTLSVALFATTITFVGVPITAVEAASETYVTNVDNFIDDYPYGRSNYRHKIYYMKDDGNSNYDFWANKMIFETVPGYVLDDNTWVTEEGRPYVKQCNGTVLLETTFEKTIYGPTTVSETVGFEAGLEKGGANGSLNYSYSQSTNIPETEIRYKGDLSQELSKWQLIYDDPSDRTTFQFQPATNMRVSEGSTYYFESYNYARFDSPFHFPRELEKNFCAFVSKP